MTILRRAGELASVASQREAIHKVADLYLRIPVEQYGLQDYRAALEIMDIGREHVRTALESGEDGGALSLKVRWMQGTNASKRSALCPKFAFTAESSPRL